MRILRGLLFGGLALLVSSFLNAQPVDHPDLSVIMVGGPAFTVPRAIPNSVDVIAFPPSDDPPLVIRAIITNTGAQDFVGIPDQTVYTTAPGEPFLLFGTVGTENGEFIFEGDGLRDLPASPPFLGGFVLKPGESRLFILHIIYGMLCNGCVFPPGSPLLEPAPCGSKITLLDNIFDIRTGTVDQNGTIVSDPDIPAEIREPVEVLSTPTVLVTCELSVSIDIKPGSFPNSINLRSQGVIPVALLGSDVFSFADLDIGSLRFGPNGARPAAGTGWEDVNGDGKLDLVTHYKTQETGLAPGQTEACLRATAGSHTLRGCDSIRIVPPK